MFFALYPVCDKISKLKNLLLPAEFYRMIEIMFAELQDVILCMGYSKRKILYQRIP